MLPAVRRSQMIGGVAVQRGTDVYKCLALGASGVGIGRAALMGLAAFGQAVSAHQCPPCRQDRSRRPRTQRELA